MLQTFFCSTEKYLIFISSREINSLPLSYEFRLFRQQTWCHTFETDAQFFQTSQHSQLGWKKYQQSSVANEFHTIQRRRKGFVRWKAKYPGTL